MQKVGSAVEADFFVKMVGVWSGFGRGLVGVWSVGGAFLCDTVWFEGMQEGALGTCFLA